MITPPFGGYSPVLPAPINIGIQALFQEAMDRNRPRTGSQREALELRREVSFGFLHEYFEAETHERAIDLIKNVWKQREPFCLYLRNFGLGSRTSEPAFGRPLADGTVPYMIGADMRLEDERFQSVLSTHIAPKLAMVAVENPAFDYRKKTCLPRLALADASWRATVSDLIAAAEVIIVYFNQPTRGVSDEIAMIRDSGRQGATILVMLPEASGTTGFPDFPITLTWQDFSTDPAPLWDAIHSLPPQESHKHFAANPPTPAPPSAPLLIRQEADLMINAGLTLAGDEFRQEKFVDMDDRLSACIAMSYWGDIAEARALAYLWIATGQFRREKGYAPDNLERALDIFERLIRSGRYARFSPPQMFDQIVPLLSPYQGNPRMESHLERIRRLQHL